MKVRHTGILALFLLAGWYCFGGGPKVEFAKCHHALAKLHALPKPDLDGINDPKIGVSIFDIHDFLRDIEGDTLFKELNTLYAAFEFPYGRVRLDQKSNPLLGPFLPLTELVEDYIEERFQRRFYLQKFYFLGCNDSVEGHAQANTRHPDKAAIAALINWIQDPVVIELPNGSTVRPPIGSLVVYRGMALQKAIPAQTAIYHWGDYQGRRRLTTTWDYYLDEKGNR